MQNLKKSVATAVALLVVPYMVVRATPVHAEISAVEVVHLSVEDSAEISQKMEHLSADKTRGPADRRFSYERRVLVVEENKLILGCTRAFYDDEYFNDQCVLNLKVATGASTSVHWRIDNNMVMHGSLTNPATLHKLQFLLDDSSEFSTFEFVPSLNLPRLHIHCAKTETQNHETPQRESCDIIIVPNIYSGEVQYEDESDR